MNSRNDRNRRTPVALVLAVVLLGLGGVSIAAAATTPALVREDVVVRTNPSTNLTPNDPGAMPTDEPSTTGTASSTDEPTGTPTATSTTDAPDPLPVETTSATVVPTRNPVRATDEADPVDPLPEEPVVEETTFNPVEPTTETPVPPRPTN